MTPAAPLSTPRPSRDADASGDADGVRWSDAIDQAIDQVAADYPLAMMASPEIANYAPPENQWPLRRRTA